MTENKMKDGEYPTISQDVVWSIEKREKVYQETKRFFQAIAQEVEKLDDDSLLLPGEIGPNAISIEWKFVEDALESKIDLSEDNEKLDKTSDKKDKNDSEINIGLYLWSPEGKAVLSLYIEYISSNSYENDWQKIKELKKKFNGKINLLYDEWEERVEIESIPLDDIVQGKVKVPDIARKVYDIAKKVYDTEYSVR